MTCQKFPNASNCDKIAFCHLEKGLSSLHHCNGSVYCWSLSRAVRAPDFAALAQVRVVPGPVVAVVNVLSKQQVLSVQLQRRQHNLTAACKPSTPIIKRLRHDLNTSSHHLGSRPNCHPLGNMQSLLHISGVRAACRGAGVGTAGIANYSLITCFACRRTPRRRS